MKHWGFVPHYGMLARVRGGASTLSMPGVAPVAFGVVAALFGGGPCLCRNLVVPSCCREYSTRDAGPSEKRPLPVLEHPAIYLVEMPGVFDAPFNQTAVVGGQIHTDTVAT